MALTPTSALTVFSIPFAEIKVIFGIFIAPNF
jgi:hypothetical protein